MPKQILRGDVARQALQKGLNEVVDSVKATLGPRGRNVLLDRLGQPDTTRDGVTVAKYCANLPDPFENMGAQYAKECADAVVTDAGDGTTTTCVILQAIVNGGMELVKNGAEPLALADGIAAAAEACAESIKKMAIEATPELVKQAAIISTHGDVELGSMIAEATCKVGATGVLELQESRDEKTTIEHLEGYYFERGWATHQEYVTDRNSQKCVLKNPLILISERIIAGSGLKPLPDGNVQILGGDGIGAILNLAVKARRPLLIIAEDMIGDALGAFNANLASKQLVGGCFVKLPGFAEQRAAALNDLKTAIGAKRIHSMTSTAIKDQLSSFNTEDLGTCEQAVISRTRTVLLGPGGSELAIFHRVEELKTQVGEAENPFEKVNLEARIARLAGGVAVLRVGAESEPSMLEKKARAEDAIHCCRGALQEGIVPGGGVALLRAAMSNQSADPAKDLPFGQLLLLQAICEPAKQIVRNAGETAVDRIIASVVASTSLSMGFDSSSGCFGDMYLRGIVDPTKVVLTALKKAASIGALLLTTEVLCCDIPEPKPQMMPPGAFRM